jgi:hypothetical protein
VNFSQNLAKYHLWCCGLVLWAILEEFHNSAHEGYQKGLQHIKSVFYWQGMKQQFKAFIKHCDVCQRLKASNTKPAGLLQPLPIPSQIWTDISMDFIDGLPLSHGKTPILFYFILFFVW